MSYKKSKLNQVKAFFKFLYVKNCLIKDLKRKLFFLPQNFDIKVAQPSKFFWINSMTFYVT
jgi:hypothetical protein